METPIQKLIQEIKNNTPITEIDGQFYISLEKELLCKFWVEGNKQGWAMTTDYEEDAKKYYNSLIVRAF
ncbi:MAG: hypothetical protein ACRC2M_08555 [Planktothrix sp.]